MNLRFMRDLWSGRTVRLVLGMVLCVGFAATAGGCNIVAAGGYLAYGPPKVSAQYELPDRKMVVFVDDRANRLPRSRLRREIAMSTTEELVNKQELITTAISPDAAIRAASAADIAGELLTIDEIGRSVGAEMVIYITIDAFSVTSADSMPRPICLMRVKVIDAMTGERMFPDTPGGIPINAQMNFKTEFAYAPDQLPRLEEDLARFSGLRASQLFWDHEVNPLDGQINY